jgi:NAD+ kinase
MPVKVLVVGHDADAFRERVRWHGFELVDSDPDVLIAYGGDGSFIGAERLYPGVPKMGFRRDDSCIKCRVHADDVVLGRLRDGSLHEDRLMKLHGERDGDEVLAVNDITFRNSDPRAAVRFVLYLDDQRVTEEMIGDGLVVCTPFGSTAYFRSITRTMIRTGIGIAFNNVTDLLSHLVIGESEKIRVAITRGPATLSADNDDRFLHLATGDTLTIGKAEEEARVLGIDTLRCTECRYVHAPRRRY